MDSLAKVQFIFVCKIVSSGWMDKDKESTLQGVENKDPSMAPYLLI